MRRPSRRHALFPPAAAAAAALATPAPAATPPTAVEQFALELINATRLDPNRAVWADRNNFWGDGGVAHAPDLNEGLPGSTIFATPRQPLAFNANLTQAAR